MATLESRIKLFKAASIRLGRGARSNGQKGPRRGVPVLAKLKSLKLGRGRKPNEKTVVEGVPTLRSDISLPALGDDLHAYNDVEKARLKVLPGVIAAMLMSAAGGMEARACDLAPGDLSQGISYTSMLNAGMCLAEDNDVDQATCFAAPCESIDEGETVELQRVGNPTQSQPSSRVQQQVRGTPKFQMRQAPDLCNRADSQRLTSSDSFGANSIPGI